MSDQPPIHLYVTSKPDLRDTAANGKEILFHDAANVCSGKYCNHYVRVESICAYLEELRATAISLRQRAILDDLESLISEEPHER